MHRIVIALMLLLSAATTGAQEAATQKATAQPAKYFMEVVAQRVGPSKSTQVTIEPGRLLPSRLGIRDEDLKKVVQSLSFSSVADALNFLAARGWEPLDTYTISGAGSGSAVHIVMMAETADPQALAASLLGKAP